MNTLDGYHLGDTKGVNKGYSHHQHNTSRHNDGWRIVDCCNYIVHVLDDMTRKSVDLESLWGDPRQEVRNMDNDVELDTFVEDHPVSDQYHDKVLGESGGIGTIMEDRMWNRMVMGNSAGQVNDSLQKRRTQRRGGGRRKRKSRIYK